MVINMKKLWGWIVGAFAIILGLFFYQKKRADDAEAENVNAEFKAKDQLLDYQQQQQASDIDKNKQNLDELRKQHDKDIEENQKDLSPEQVEEYWKRRNNPK